MTEEPYPRQPATVRPLVIDQQQVLRNIRGRRKVLTPQDTPVFPDPNFLTKGFGAGEDLRRIVLFGDSGGGPGVPGFVFPADPPQKESPLLVDNSVLTSVVMNGMSYEFRGIESGTGLPGIISLSVETPSPNQPAPAASLFSSTVVEEDWVGVTGRLGDTFHAYLKAVFIGGDESGALALPSVWNPGDLLQTTVTLTRIRRETTQNTFFDQDDPNNVVLDTDIVSDSVTCQAVVETQIITGSLAVVIWLTSEELLDLTYQLQIGDNIEIRVDIEITNTPVDVDHQCIALVQALDLVMVDPGPEAPNGPNGGGPPVV